MMINRRSIALGLTVGVLAGGAGGALAAMSSETSTSGASATATSWTGNGAWIGYGPGPGWSGYGADSSGYGPDWSGYGEIAGINFARTATEATAADLGLTTAQLKAELRSGRTLADLAHAQRKSVSGLENAILTAIASSVQSDSSLTTDQKATIIADAKSWIDVIVNNSCPVAGNWPAARPGPMLPY